ncbi:CASP8-associated protein 2 isoform X2 [Stegostoma tigrinum]|uniref:CASP8-associated protein 2 isoform X2 n=1 Tax=Stegostoma tigrinum TaxID=3053191 RepID=UPI00287085C5|nr:CASP8-associated protein 2 isoform X2 [Stegostoma tigrinum]
MENDSGSSHMDYLYGDLLQQDSLVDTTGKGKSAKDCFDLYEEILTEERTANEISLKEFQEKFIERERKVEELLKKLHEVQIQNSTLSNENTQLKKNMSALIKTARLEIVRKDEEINRLNRRESLNWIGNPGLRHYHKQHHHPPGSFNVPTTPQADNRSSSPVLHCPSRPAHCQPAAHLNKEGDCLEGGSLRGASKPLEPKAQCNLKNSLSNSQSALCVNSYSKISPHTDKEPVHRSNAVMDKMRPSQSEERRRVDKINGEHLGKHTNTEKLDSSIVELSNLRKKSKGPNFLEKTDKFEPTSLSMRPHSEIRGSSRHAPEKRRHHFNQGELLNCSKESLEARDKRTYAEKEERHKEKDTRRSGPREREQKMDQRKDQKCNRDVDKDNKRNDKLRGQAIEKERDPIKCHDKTKEYSKLTRPESPQKHPRRNSCTASEHTIGERQDQKIERKNSGKKRNIEDNGDRRNKHSKVNDHETPKDNRKHSDKNDNRSLKKAEIRKEEKSKSEHKDRRNSNVRHSSRDGGDCAKRERKHRVEKDKTKSPENHGNVTERPCVDQKSQRIEESVCDGNMANLLTADEQNLIRNTDPKLHFMKTLQLTVSPVKRPSTVLCEVDDEMQCSQLLSEDLLVESAEKMASGSAEANFILDKISNQSDEAQAMDTNCKSTELPVGGTEVQAMDTNCKSTELPIAGTEIRVSRDSPKPVEHIVGQEEPLQVEEEEEVQVMLAENAPDQPMEYDCIVHDTEKLTPIVVETMGTVEVVSEAIYEVTKSAKPVVEIKGTDPAENMQSVGNASEVDNERVGRMNGKSPWPTQANSVSVDGPSGSSHCLIELDSTINNEKIGALNVIGKPEDSGQPVDVKTAATEAWTGNSEVGFTSCETQQPNGSTVDSSSTVNKTPVKNFCIAEDQEENSIQSIDFTYIGCIPEPISPLTSPLRPIRPSTLETAGIQKEKDVDHKDSALKFQGNCSSRNCTQELNKENQEPLCKTGEKSLGILLENCFSEEIEEGEIVSDEEASVPEIQKAVSNIQMEKESNKEKRNPCKGKPKEEARLVNPEASTLNCSETMTKIKSSKKQRKPEKVTSDQNADVEILNPSSMERDQIKSSVSNLMGALMVARKTIRKKYMKLHKQFEIHKFQRIVEIASADFISVVKRSNFPKSRRLLKTSICAEIESILLQAKCNGIVNSIFSQQAPNMKEKLWLFVDQQFDFMFGKVREMFISCESISLELALEEKRENERLNKKQKKNTVVKQFKDKFNKLPKLKGSPPSSRPSLTNNSSSKKNSGKNKPTNLDKKLKGTPVLNKHSKKSVVCSANGIPKEEAPSTKGKHELSVTQVNSIDPSTNSNTLKDCHDKTELGILTEQQASTLTFNLVSDAQMGEIFKCLLQGSDLLDQGITTLECNSWPAPEKVRPDIGAQILSNDSNSEKPPPVSQLDAATWPPVTPSAHAVGLRPPLDLDILDESCMLEIPDKVMQTKDSAISPREDSNSQKIIESSSVQQAHSSVSSILVEDLAVSLTVPSPLKSDGQISFLTSQNGESLHEGVSKAILSAHYSESALLDEEDVSEQDIHLALDSDNSSSQSSNSSMWNKQVLASPCQYQLHPPMQAVVMEKSNDHFIVKIRCRPPGSKSTRQSSPSLAAEENLGFELEPNNDLGTEMVNETAASCSSGGEVLGQDQTLLESSHDQSLTVRRPEDNSKKLGIDADVKLPHSEEDRPSIEKHINVEPSLKTPSGNVENVLLTTATCTEDRGTLSSRKRKCNVKADSTVKRPRKENELFKSTKSKDKESKRKQTSLSSAKKAFTSKAVTSKKSMANPSQSTAKSPPTSLPAKNIIKRNGEVVVTWTRENDRAILLSCQQKGANEETFSYIAGKLHRSPDQVSERFHRLMKLFKKSEHMNN